MTPTPNISSDHVALAQLPNLDIEDNEGNSAGTRQCVFHYEARPQAFRLFLAFFRAFPGVTDIYRARVADDSAHPVRGSRLQYCWVRYEADPANFDNGLQVIRGIPGVTRIIVPTRVLRRTYELRPDGSIQVTDADAVETVVTDDDDAADAEVDAIIKATAEFVKTVAANDANTAANAANANVEANNEPATEAAKATNNSVDELVRTLYNPVDELVRTLYNLDVNEAH